jgi:uracil-DNA glycosylase family 4
MAETPPDTYLDLVRDRKKCHRCESLTNPAVCEAIYDSDHIGPWSSWHGTFNPQLMIIGQDWGDTATYRRQLGKELPEKSPTDQTLAALVGLIGLDMDAVFLTNAVLCLKEGGAQARVRTKWFRNCGKPFLKPTIEIVNPRVLVTLGVHAYRSVEKLFGLPHVEKFREAVCNVEGFILLERIRLFPMYHPSPVFRNRRRPLPEQQQDWSRIKPALSGK